MSRTRTPRVFEMQLNALLLRGLWEQFQKAARLAEERTREAHYAEDSFDISSLPILETKAYPGVRDVAAIDLVVGHVTDVRNGFGVQKWGPCGWKHWLTELKGGRVPPQLLEQLRKPMDPLDLAKRVALWARYRNTPYHQVAAGNGDVLDNRPLHSRTKASSAGNGGVAFAVDCAHDQQLSLDDIKTGQAAIRRLVRRLRSAGNTRPLRYAPHRCFDRSRRRDTDREVHLAIVKPTIASLNRVDRYGIRIDYEVAMGGGLPISTRDDPEAHFDERGRRVRGP